MMLLLCLILAQELLLYDRPREAAEQYLAQAAGTIELLVVQPGPNAYGHHALGYGGQSHTDLELPNPAFFRHLDWVVKRATGRGLQVKLLAPGPGSGYPEEKRAEFLRYLRKRYERNRRVEVSVLSR
ncbi:DUF4038 domain-containing protein [Bryobacter aggregatus]|uniref:apiosidase-like domain-containing protein n=1 Tax=Bryobacter aggregatus TaxID=360054 RepID=UPI0004E0B39B|nr:DUF4038 domain-containing protein [Bryobacter aggregatus]